MKISSESPENLAGVTLSYDPPPSLPDCPGWSGAGSPLRLMAETAATRAMMANFIILIKLILFYINYFCVNKFIFLNIINIL